MEVSLQTGSIANEYDVETFCKVIKQAGISYIDYNSIELAVDREDIWKGRLPNGSILEKSVDEIIEYFKPELEIFEKYGIKFAQAHAPFPSCVTDRPHVLEYMIKIYKNCILFCDRVGIPNLVIHGVSMYFWDKQSCYKDIDELNMKLYSSLVETLKGTSVTVCLENVFVDRMPKKYVAGHCSNADKTVKIIDELNSLCEKEHFGLCLDTGHLNLAGVDTREYIETVGNRIKCLHVHDNRGTNDDHKMPYSGNIDWREFLTAMKNIGYRGDVNFETFMQTKKEFLPSALLLPTVKYIGEMGRYFIDAILGNAEI